eukprot:Colp12_sorted_trinity150504_noHs@10796
MILLDGNGLSKVAWAINIGTTEASEMVAKKLERNDSKNTLHTVLSVGDLKNTVRELLKRLLIVFCADNNGPALAGCNLLKSVLGLGVCAVTHNDHEHGHVLVNESEGTVLKLTREDTLGVHVCKLLDLESTLKAGGKLITTAHHKKRLLGVELFRKLADLLVHLEHLLDLIRELLKSVNNGMVTLLLALAIVGEHEGAKNERDDLGSVGLCGGNTDFGTSVYVDTAVRLARDGGADGVGDTNAHGTALLAVSKGHQSVGSLTRLRKEEADVITEDRSLTVEEVRGELDGHGELGHFLHERADSNGGVVRGTAGNENQATGTTHGVDVLGETTKVNSVVLEVHTTTHRVEHRVGLLIDLLLHEVIELALHDLLELNVKGLDGTVILDTLLALEAVDEQLATHEVSNIVVLKENDTFSVLNDGRGVRGKEVLGAGELAISGDEAGGRVGEGAGSLGEGLAVLI